MGAAVETKTKCPRREGGRGVRPLGVLGKCCDKKGKMADTLTVVSSVTLNFWSPFWEMKLIMLTS